jgi:hypothetical protein
MTDRITVLAAAGAAESGPWTTARVLRLWCRRGVAAPKRATTRHAVDQLARRGRLVRNDSNPARREYYTPEVAR